MFVAIACLLGLGAGVSPAEDRAVAPEEFRDARQLLEALERADEGIRTLTADVRYDKIFKLQGDTHRRLGTLRFRTERAPGEPLDRAFRIDFTSLQIGQRLENDPETWIFDGRWLVETHPARRQFIKREIAGADDRFDPLAIGEGPMPIPIGQKADEVLSRYHAELAPAGEPFGDDETALSRFVADTWQIVLTPRLQSSRDEKFKEIRIWYSKTGERRLLPRMARTLARGGDVSYVQLINIETNTGVPDTHFDVTPPPPGEGWDVQVEPLPEAPRRNE